MYNILYSGDLVFAMQLPESIMHIARTLTLISLCAFSGGRNPGTPGVPERTHGSRN